MIQRLLKHELKALRDLRGIMPDDDIVIIGATALRLQATLDWRETKDIDLTIAIDIDEFRERVAQLPGWHADTRQSQRWYSDATAGYRATIDIIPAAPDLIARGILVWPRGHQMNLAGLDLAFQHGIASEYEGLTVKIAPVPVIVILKITAYLDRPHERERDLSDIANVLENYVHSTSDRRFTPEMFEKQLAFEAVSPFMLGRDVRAIARETHHGLIDNFFSRLLDEARADGARLSQMGPPSLKTEEARRNSIRAFCDGYGLAQRSRQR